MKKITPTMHMRSGWHQVLSLAVAAVFTVMAVLQLFWFEGFPDELALLLPAEWAQSSIVVAAAFVIAEVFAVAYFLPVALSSLARWCIRTLAWVAPIGWIVLMLGTVAQAQAAHAAYIGAKFDVPLSWVSVACMVTLLAAVATVTIVDLRKS